MPLSLNPVRGWWTGPSLGAPSKEDSRHADRPTVSASSPAMTRSCFPPSQDTWVPTPSIPVVIAFAIGITAGYALFLPLHHWRLRRVHRLARQRADPLWLLPSQEDTLRLARLLHVQRALSPLSWSTPPLMRDTAGSSPSSLVASTSVSATATTDWGQRLLRRVYRGHNTHSSGAALSLHWQYRPVRACTLRRLLPAHQSHTTTTTPTTTPASSVPVASPLWLLQKQSFNILYSPDAQIPLWCGYYMAPDSVACARQQRRVTNFFADHSVPKAQRASLGAVKRLGFDRGHLAPHASVASTPQAAVEAALLTNVVLQHRGVNRGVWKQLERLTREYVLTGASEGPLTSAPHRTAATRPGRARATNGVINQQASQKSVQMSKSQAKTRRTKAAVTKQSAARQGAKARTKRVGGRKRRSGGTRACARAVTTRTSALPAASSAVNTSLPKRGRGRPRRLPAATPSLGLSSSFTPTSAQLLTSLMEAHTPFSLTVAARARRQRRRAFLLRVPAVGQRLVQMSERCDAWRHRVTAAWCRLGQRHRARQRPRLAVCTGPLFFTDAVSISTVSHGASSGALAERKRRGGPPRVKSVPVDKGSTDGKALVPDALFLGLWDPVTHNHIAFVVPNSAAGDVRPPTATGGLASDWRPVLEPLVVDWSTLEALLTRSTARFVDVSDASLLPLRILPHLQDRRLWRTAGVRWRRQMQQHICTWRATVRARLCALFTKSWTLRRRTEVTRTRTTGATPVTSADPVPIAVLPQDVSARPKTVRHLGQATV